MTPIEEKFAQGNMTLLEILTEAESAAKNATPEGSARTALKAIEDAGFRIVPVEPTEEMYEKGMEAIHEYCPKDVYKAMLEAAPK